MKPNEISHILGVGTKLSEKFSSELLFINIFQGPLKMYINMELKNNQEIWKTLLNSKNVAHSVIE